MKEVTYEDWQKNPTPRMMWVWNDDVENKEKIKVAYVLNNGCTYRVLSIVDEESAFERFKHCAEIKKQRRMTNKELSWWLSEKPHRERKYARAPYIYTYYTYNENEQDEEVSDNFLIRENGGEWREPLVGVEDSEVEE